MNLLFSITKNYIRQLETVLFSIRENNKNKDFIIYLLTDDKGSLHAFKKLNDFCSQISMKLEIIQVPSTTFSHAPKTSRYPQMIYYRLVAQNFLPATIDRILYLDCDLLCLNSFDKLYNIDFQDKLYVAASHTESIRIGNTFNKIRLGNYDAENYFNSGVLLMNLNKIREEVHLSDIYNFIDQNSLQLFLPDQDILNALYGDKIKSIPDIYYNYDTRFFGAYKLLNGGNINLDWIAENTVFLHFCGRDKPWQKNYTGKFAALYKYYRWLAYREINLKKMKQNT